MCLMNGVYNEELICIMSCFSGAPPGVGTISRDSGTCTVFTGAPDISAAVPGG